MKEILYILVIFGLALSIYSSYVTSRIKRNINYRPFCDVNNRVSCTKVFNSLYGSHFGIPNSWWGVIFYIFIFVLLTFGYLEILFFSAMVSVFFSLYLGYLMYSRIGKFCFICSLIYLINIALAIISYNVAF